jgi:hypothetical protein
MVQPNHQLANLLGDEPMASAMEQQVIDELAEAIRNLLAYGSRYHGAAKAALKGYEAWSKANVHDPALDDLDDPRSLGFVD